MALSANDVASVVIARSGNWLTSMQLQKLLYYVQSWHLAVTNEPLFEEECEAWVQGPVVHDVWTARKDHASRVATGQGRLADLGETASAIVDLVLAMYGSMSGDELSQLTHAERPWREARRGLPEHAPSSEVIPRQTMAEFTREHRRLGGRTAADLAAGGVYVRSYDEPSDPIDIDAFLEQLGPEFDETSDVDDGADVELRGADLEGIETIYRRAYAAS